MPTFGSLFAGIGGIDLGLERAGWECRWQVEWDPYCQAVLRKHWPDVPRYGDITAVDWSGVERVDLLAGGFPCQPVSSAGKKAAQADPRWLWPEFRRAIGDLRPRLVLVENVTNLLGVNGGSAFGDVLGDLAASGYDAEWDCIPADAVGAFHERDRVWLVAYTRRFGLQPDGGPREASGTSGPTQGKARQRQRRGNAIGDGREDAGPMADPHGDGLARSRLHAGPGRPWAPTPDAHRDGPEVADTDRGRRAPGTWRSSIGRVSIFDSLRHPRGIGLALGDTDGSSSDAFTTSGGSRGTTSQPGRWLPEPPLGRVVDGLPGRVDELQGLGNAVVPQVVEVIGNQLRAALERLDP